MLDSAKISAQYQEALFRSILPFWLSHSRDALCGGYFNSLLDTGEVFDTDKHIHLQAQQAWAFGWLYNRVDAQSAWLDLARHGIDFLKKWGRSDEDGRWFGIVDRRGRPVAPAPTVVPDCFATMALAQWHTTTGDEEAAALAVETLETILEHRRHQHRQWENELGSFRVYKHLSEPMMLLKALLETQALLDPDVYQAAYEQTIHELLNEFVDRRINLLRENILPGGGFSDSSTGRRIHPGLGFETAGYLLEAAALNKNRRLAQQVMTLVFHLADLSWDDQQGGFFQYIDLKERPCVDSEWDRKLAWVHLEAAAVLAQGYALTQHPDGEKWLKRVHEYLWTHFSDKNGKEWFGTLDRNGHPVNAVKASPQKGCYHSIKSLHTIWRSLEKLPAARGAMGKWVSG